MNIFKLIVLMMCVAFSPVAMAQTTWFEMSYPADEQVSGCEVRHNLYDDSTNTKVSMLWVATSICSGEVVANESIVFSQNTMKAWPVLLHKAAAWADSTSNETSLDLHHWGDNIDVKVVKQVDILGEEHIYFRVQNMLFSGELQRPLLVSVSEHGWKILSDAIASKAFMKYVVP